LKFWDFVLSLPQAISPAEDQGPLKNHLKAETFPKIAQIGSVELELSGNKKLTLPFKKNHKQKKTFQTKKRAYKQEAIKNRNYNPFL
jgi:hypothetical protein